MKTNEYANERTKRQSSESVYIAANITEQDITNGFVLGDGMEYGGYSNHPLNPGVYYNVGLLGAVDGSETPLFNVVESPFSECSVWNGEWECVLSTLIVILFTQC